MPYLSASEVIIHKEALSGVLFFHIPLPCGMFSGVTAQLNPGRGTDIDDHLSPVICIRFAWSFQFCMKLTRQCPEIFATGLTVDRPPHSDSRSFLSWINALPKCSYSSLSPSAMNSTVLTAEYCRLT